MAIPPDWKLLRRLLNVLLSLTTFWLVASIRQWVWDPFLVDAPTFWLLLPIVTSAALVVAGALVAKRRRDWIRWIGFGVMAAGVLEFYFLAGNIIWPPF